MVEGVTLEPIASATPEQEAAAARAFGEVAMNINNSFYGGEHKLNPKG